MPEHFTWSAPPLAMEEQRLVDAYGKRRKPLDQLPYTDDFDQLVRDLGMEPTAENKRLVFHRLLNLRKMARLPRGSNQVSVVGEGMPLSAEDEELLAAYARIGRPLDSLPYTSAFDSLVEDLGKPGTPAMKHAAFQRLLQLRKRGRLPTMTLNISFVVAPDHMIRRAEKIRRSQLRVTPLAVRQDIQALAKAYIEEANRLKGAVRDIQTGSADINIESRSPPEMIERARRLRTVRLPSKRIQEDVRSLADSYVRIAEKNHELFEDFVRRYGSQLSAEST